MKKFILLSIISFLFSCSMNEKKTGEDKVEKSEDIARISEFQHAPVQKDGAVTVGEKRKLGHSITNYDKAGNIVDVSFHDKNGVVNTKMVNKWEGSKMLESIKFDMNGRMQEKIIYSYKGDQKEKAIFHDKNGPKGDYEKYQYQGDSLEIIEFYTAKNELLRRTAHSYKNKTLTRTLRYSPDGQMNFKNIYKVDDKGNVIASTAYTYPNGVEYKYLLKTSYLSYDEKGNWTQKTVGTGNKIENVVVREITYY